MTCQQRAFETCRVRVRAIANRDDQHALRATGCPHFLVKLARSQPRPFSNRQGIEKQKGTLSSLARPTNEADGRDEHISSSREFAEIRRISTVRSVGRIAHLVSFAHTQTPRLTQALLLRYVQSVWAGCVPDQSAGG